VQSLLQARTNALPNIPLIRGAGPLIAARLSLPGTFFLVRLGILLTEHSTNWYHASENITNLD
jgi:hypothetical protein